MAKGSVDMVRLITGNNDKQPQLKEAPKTLEQRLLENNGNNVFQAAAAYQH